ncbi:MAG: GTPase HflX [Pseudomonadota bacterium]
MPTRDARIAGSLNDGKRPLQRASRSAQAREDEAVGLAAAISLHVVSVESVALKTVRPATLLGSGKVETLANAVKTSGIELVFVDHDLTPIQQRNLERGLNAKVLDRTGLILEIFGRRAQTREGTLQVELAHLTYQKSRLVRSWTHLERQRGGKGFLGGPGETQIESDRRVIQAKITRLKNQLENVRRTRTLHRTRRQEVPAPTVALVGYTNAGKSTLFNYLTENGVFAEDLLFATLDPTLRKLRLPRGTEVVLSDTVGFISDLPTALIAAFRATLEEVLEADVIVHVRDITHPDTDHQKADVIEVLAELGIMDRDGQSDRSVIEVWNKADLLDEEGFLHLSRRSDAMTTPIALVSAITGQGADALLEMVEQTIASVRAEATFHVPVSDGEGRAWLFAHATVLSEVFQEDGSTVMRVAMTPRNMALARARFSSMTKQRPSGEALPEVAPREEAGSDKTPSNRVSPEDLPSDAA